MNKNFLNDKNISAVIFDLDNTLSDRKYAFSHHADRLAQMFLANRSPREKADFSEMLIRLDNNGYCDKKAVYAEICRKFSLVGNESKMNAEWDVSASMFCRKEPFADEILSYLKKKYTLALLTNGHNSTQNIKLDGVGLRHFFSYVMISEETGTAKPDREIFLMLCRRMSVEPQNTLYIGDHPENDYFGPLSAGMNAVLYDRYGVSGNNITNKISSLSELKEIL